ncbi:hydrogenobyrinic acid a,c-diamide synthase (glutamine-hydrolysing)/cobyrinate a,c-diamide synthase [Thermoplasmatales archaeon BRNA1]|nr:hydrogenobyrinic acid a,c-diamide synthase (glutamine-hydrolysing)/cobyrinate a,c-diamide synthase [Thermoplasmatales archaeon BRNA1]
MITAPASGSGKTLVTCGILQALVNRGMKVSSFKCGPDYIDPMFHARVIGTRSRNLDTFFCDDGTLKYIFKRSAEPSDISVIEAVMGFYDGMRSGDTRGSSYEVSEKLEAPVILLVNTRGTSISCVATIKGFKEFRKNRIAGVILNNMSPGVYADVSPIIEREIGLKVIGYVPKMKDLVLESRHLGLVLPDEVSQLKENLNTLAERLEETLDIDALIDIANGASDIDAEEPEHGVIDGKVKIGLAYDDTFCFTYEDNIALLEECGAEIVRFSPMHDRKIPDGVCGIILSGGYPELHGEALSSNKSMLQDLKSKVDAGMPCLAECGGFMYLHERMEDADGKVWPMAGVIQGEVRNTGKLTRFGYVALTSGSRDSILGSGAKGHEFHYWDSSNPGESWTAVKSSGKTYTCGHEKDGLAAGFPHLYYYSNPDIAYRFVKKCQMYGSR